MTQFDTIVRGGNVVGADAVVPADIAIVDAAIVAIAPDLAGTAGSEIDARGLHVFPGAIDIHVHFNEPGRTDWEGWTSGAAASAAGGTTAVAEMPLNANPPTLDGESFDQKRAAAAAASVVDFALWGGLTPDSLATMDELAARGVIGFKAFMSASGTSEFRAADDATLLAGMHTAARLGLPVAVHAENDQLTSAYAAQARAAGRAAMRDYLHSRPAVAETEAISRAIHFAAEAGCTLHIVHVSTGRGVAIIADARARGLDVTAETCPHYLVFDEEDAVRLGAVAKCAPPLRTRDEVDALWQSLSRGDIQIVASDHSPAPPAMKVGDDFFQIWGGISGCQSLLPVLLDAGHTAHGLPLPLLASLLAMAPAKRLRLARKGRLAPGYDADLVLVDLSARPALRESDLHYRHRQSPFVGMPAARVVRTLRRGETIAREGRAVAASPGRLITPEST
ncbi:MAG: allantoinase AllB [Thermomicrobiales bacterium]